MPTLYAEIDINAPQSVVWEALMRKDQWRFWNTFFYDCDPGLQIARGNEIFLAMQRLEGDEETELQPVITMLRPPYLMKWVSTIPGLRSEHIFELQETMPGRTHYIHRETISGILSKVFLPFIRQDERQGLRRMSQQLKMHVENNILGNPPMDRYGQDRYGQRLPNQRQPQPRGYQEQQPYGRGYNDYPAHRGSQRPYRDQPYDDRGYGNPDYGNPDYGPRTDGGYNNDYPRNPRNDGYPPRRR